jgi:MFS transporter, UMF1 family
VSAGSFSIWQRPVIGWAMYDFANTIFSFAVLTFYFNEWVIQDLGRSDWQLNATNALVSLVLVFVLPALGAVADARGTRKPFLIAFTCACALTTVALGYVGSAGMALVVGGLAIFWYQCALAQYDPLLADVAPEEYRGRVSGFGVGLGYIGTLIGAIILKEIVGDGDKQMAFLPTALMMLVFSVPAFLWVRERRKSRTPRRGVARAAVGQLRVTARKIRGEHPDLMRFLLARFLYADAMLTIIAMMTVYMDRLGDFDSTTKLTVQGMSMAAAACGAFLAGRMVEAVGPRKVLIVVLTVAATTLFGAAVSGAPGSVWLLGPLVGICLGGVWTSDRVFMMRLSPPSARGEFFSLYNLVGRVSAGVGPLVLWGGTIWLLHERLDWSVLAASRMALVALMLATIAGLLMIIRLSDARRDWGDDLLETAIAEQQA